MLPLSSHSGRKNRKRSRQNPFSESIIIETGRTGFRRKKMDIVEGYVPFRNGQTYYRIVGYHYKKTPVVFIHGGPGSTHNSFEVLDSFADYDRRPVVMYDQYGCGLSSLGLENDTKTYSKETWVEELSNLRERLGLTKMHMMGHSWGGMLSIIYLCDYHPEGILSCTLSSTLASASLWDKETHRLIRYLDKEDRDAIAMAEKTGDYSTEAFQKANADYLKMTVRNLEEMKDVPECLLRERPKSPSYVTAWGVSEFRPSGNLKDYEYLDKLGEIQVPIMLLSGADDESTPLQNKEMFDRIRTEKEWHILSPSRHSIYIEQNKAYQEYLKSFLDRHE